MHQDDNTLGIFSWVVVPTHAVAANLKKTYTPTGSQELLSRLLVWEAASNAACDVVRVLWLVRPHAGWVWDD